MLQDARNTCRDRWVLFGALLAVISVDWAMFVAIVYICMVDRDLEAPGSSKLIVLSAFFLGFFTAWFYDEIFLEEYPTFGEKLTFYLTVSLGLAGVATILLYIPEIF